MKNKKSVLIAISVLVLVTLTLLGLTYAYYRTRVVGNLSTDPSISVESVKMEVVYEDDSAVLTATDVEPSNDVYYSKEFTVENTGNKTSTYSIVLEEITNTFEIDGAWDYELIKNGAVSSPVKTGKIAVGTHQIIIGETSIGAGVTDTYILRLKYPETNSDQSKDMGKELTVKINIKENIVTWDNATEGTLLYGIKNNPAGMVYADGNELGKIGNSQDDYGTSYYYWGLDVYNFVNYSGMCWRIVRVQGDGTIKLVLADENHECNDDTFTYTSSSFIGGVSNTSGTSVSYTGGTIEKKLNKWITSSNLDTTKLVNTDWCNDLSYVSETFDDLGAPERQYSYSSRDKTLKCNMTGINDSKAVRINSNIGLLTADEVYFAAESGYLSSYNANEGYGWWTMTPALYKPNSQAGGKVYAVGSTKAINQTDVPAPFNIRPAIVLASDVLANGTGTEYDPYVIS